MRSSKHSVFAAILLMFADRVRAQQPPQVTLTKSIGSSSEEFQAVSSAHELSPGRVIVADVRARRIVLIDFEKATARNVGRNGAGPGEFRAVEHFIPRPGGGVLASDFYNRRLLPILPDGSFGDAIPNPSINAQFRSSDLAGRIYGDMGIFGGGRISDSARVVRWDPKTGAIDTLFVYDAGRAGMIVRPGEAFRVWRNTAKWAPLPRGDVLVVSAADYRAVILNGGREVRSVKLPFTRVPITEEDKVTFARLEDAKPIQSLGGGTPTGPRPRRTYTFPVTFPPFDDDAELLPSPDGFFWIARVISPRDSVARYDVLAPEGRLVARVALPPNSTVAALGKGSVYVVEKDSDDILRIKRYPYPPLK